MNQTNGAYLDSAVFGAGGEAVASVGKGQVQHLVMVLFQCLDLHTWDAVIQTLELSVPGHGRWMGETEIEMTQNTGYRSSLYLTLLLLLLLLKLIIIIMMISHAISHAALQSVQLKVHHKKCSRPGDQRHSKQ